MFGFLNIDKSEGMTSFDVIAKLRKILNIKQIGHSGTLDPLATGVLPVAIGKATRLIEYLSDEKAYIADIQLGKDTETYDLEGVVTKIYNKKVCIEEIQSVLSYFSGEIEQFPPLYSAVHVKGKRLYEYARSGKSDIEIPSRKVFVNAIDILEFDEEKQFLKLYIDCSKGTYIRSIAYDLGQKLQTGGFLSGLKRIKSSRFTIENSIKLENITANIKLLPPQDYIDLSRIELDENNFKKVIQGQYFKYENNFSKLEEILLLHKTKFIGIGYNSDGLIKVKKVFYEKD